MRALFIDANDTLAAIAERLHRPADFDLIVSRTPSVRPDDLPEMIAAAEAEAILIDHTYLPTPVAKRCRGLKHVVFLGTGARSYMNIEELAELGIDVATIKGYGDVAVAEATVALMTAAARGIARMDRGVRDGQWLRTDGIQLHGKTLGLIGFGGIAAEVARIAGNGFGMKVVAWNRSAKTHPGVEFVDLDTLLAASHVVSMHLLLNDETRGFLSRERIAQMRPGSIFVNTARGALADEAALARALRSGHVAAAGLDVFETEPLPAGHPFSGIDSVVLSAHSAFRTPEAADNLIGAALDICRDHATA